MPIIERELTGFELQAPLKAGSEIDSFTLTSSSKAIFKGFTFTLSFPLASVYRVLLVGPDRPAPPHDNVILPNKPLRFKVISVDPSKCQVVLAYPAAENGDKAFDGVNRTREIRIDWTESIVLSVWESKEGTEPTQLLNDINARSYALTEHGIMRHTWVDRTALHLGLGEKGAPVDLTFRSFNFCGTDAAQYDAYDSDPLYKHTPYLIVAPRPKEGALWGDERPSTYAIYHPTNSNCTWDLNRHNDEPWGQFKTFTQDWGGLEEWVMVGQGVKEVVRTFAEIVGRPKLVGRDWLGYLASGMGLGESDHPPAQELLSTWPDLCKQYDIPCSAMHLSSGYTADPETGNRYVFTMNTKRYPDFKAMTAHFHKAGIKVVPNIKPYVLATHPHYNHLYDSNAFHHDPFTGKPVVTRLWSAGVMENGKGGWSDLTSQAGREWWGKGVQSLIDLGCDGMWNDNNEYYLHDDEFLCKNEMPHSISSPGPDGPAKIGAMGRMLNTEMMAKVSNDTLAKATPNRRTYVLTRSGNVGTFKYACSTWTGDNATSWHNLRGSQAIQLNCGMSLMQSTGSDVGGFGGILPSPELFVRWVQLGVTHARFCIHSYKPDKSDPNGSARTNLPWMYPEMLPIVRREIKWRYEYLPFFNSLMWDSHLNANPTNAFLAWGEFASDPVLYTEPLIKGFDAWIGAGQLLSCPALFEGVFTRDVYFPKSSRDDQSLYFDLNAPYRTYKAGTWANVTVPIEHMGLYAREGAVIPLGKEYHTVTQKNGPSRTTPDGVDVLLENEGGVVGLDDWRGIQIFPSNEGQWSGSWIEDDGISSNPDKTIVDVNYSAKEGKKEVTVELKFTEHDFETAWGKTVAVILPISDSRSVKDGKKSTWKERTVWLLDVQ